MNEQELKDAISEMQECRELIGKANMKLNNILTQRKADMQKKLDDAYDRGYKKCLSEHEFDMPCSICDDYERGLNDAWDAAKKINLEVYDGGLSVSDLEKIFAIGGNCAVMRTFTAKEAIDRIKAHEAEKDEIRVGDEVRRISDGVKYVVVDPKNEFGRACGFSMNGIWYGERPDAIRKTGRRFNIESILKEMSE